MKKRIIIGSILFGIIISCLIIGFPIAAYNKMVAKREAIENAYSNIETQLQRRADLIPNLVNAVKGYMQHEKGIIDSITAARENLLNANGVTEAAQANEELSKVLASINVIAENYPDLKANTNFIQLQDELAGTENRIATARRDYNEEAKSYNIMIKRVPAVIFASAFGFEPAEYFEATKDVNETPEVSFD